MSGTNPNLTDQKLSKLVGGLQGQPPSTPLVVGGVARTYGDLLQEAQGDRLLYTNAEASLTAAHQAVAARNANLPAVRLLFENVHDALNAKLGSTNLLLLDYGFQPKKPKRALTVEEKQKAADKRNATRARNHTMGKRQKAQLAEESGNAQPPASPPKS